MIFSTYIREYEGTWACFVGVAPCWRGIMWAWHPVGLVRVWLAAGPLGMSALLWLVTSPVGGVSPAVIGPVIALWLVVPMGKCDLLIPWAGSVILMRCRTMKYTCNFEMHIWEDTFHIRAIFPIYLLPRCPFDLLNRCLFDPVTLRQVVHSPLMRLRLVVLASHFTHHNHLEPPCTTLNRPRTAIEPLVHRPWTCQCTDHA